MNGVSEREKEREREMHSYHLWKETLVTTGGKITCGERYYLPPNVKTLH